MTLRQFYDWQTEGGAKDVSRLVAALEEREISWCMIGGLAVNHWALETMFSEDVDLVIVPEDIAEAAKILREFDFDESRSAHSISFKGKSKITIRLHTADKYFVFPAEAVAAEVHGIAMRVADLESILNESLSAYLDLSRKPTKRMQDLLEISRMLEAHPYIAGLIPSEIYDKLEK